MRPVNRLPNPSVNKRSRKLRASLALIVCMFGSGCASSDWVKVREQPNIPLASELDIFSWRGPKASPRTRQVLRRYDLIDDLDGDPNQLLTKFRKVLDAAPTPENLHAYAEVAYIGGIKLRQKGQQGKALDLFGESAAQSYAYLFSDTFRLERNPYDPLFRRSSDLYNGALENALRIVRRAGKLKPGTTHIIDTESQQFEVRIVLRGNWLNEDFDRLEFVSDYKIKGKLRNHYRTYGLGVPLIAVHSGNQNSGPAGRYYAPGMSFPVTAFLRVVPNASEVIGDRIKHRCELELYDTLEVNQIRVNGQLVPLETDLTTALAHSLNDSTFQNANAISRGFFNAEKSSKHQGLYMLEPYNPDKIPVLLIHGLWSNLVTWMEMFNDLRGQPEIRDNYQFWFYLYPTGQPFWITSTQLREELEVARKTLDPGHTNPWLDKMVLVGHSMGGLISKMQTIESGDAFWNILSDRPIEEFEKFDELPDNLKRGFFFHPNPAIQRVVTIASPHRGSNFSNDATRWLSRKVVNLPKSIVNGRDLLLRNSDGLINKKVLSRLQTSVDTLSPESPILPVLLNAKSAPWVQYHNITGVLTEPSMISRLSGEGDGVVTFESANLEDAVSQVKVDADHVRIHTHPRTVLEVHRILLEHLNQETVKGDVRQLRGVLSRLPAPDVQGR